MRTKLVVAYEHDTADTRPVHLAVAQRPADADWTPAYRDTLRDGRRVVWVRTDRTGRVWLRDADGVRQVRPITAGG